VGGGGGVFSRADLWYNKNASALGKRNHLGHILLGVEPAQVSSEICSKFGVPPWGAARKIRVDGGHVTEMIESSRVRRR
jgi:hypothetical protein